MRGISLVVLTRNCVRSISIHRSLGRANQFDSHTVSNSASEISSLRDGSALALHS